MTITLPGILLAGLLFFLVSGSAIWIALSKGLRRVPLAVSVVVWGLLIFPLRRVVLTLLDRVLEFMLNNGPMLIASLSIPIALIAVAIWLGRIVRSKWVFVAFLLGACFVAGVVSIPAVYFSRMLVLERAVATALNGEIDPSDTTRFAWECRWDCPDLEWLRDLPRAADVRCVQSLRPHGACCQAYLEDELYSEIHIFEQKQGRYRIEFYSYPMCWNSSFEQSAERGTPESRQSTGKVVNTRVVGAGTAWADVPTPII